jgi:hypothetical protein
LWAALALNPLGFLGWRQFLYSPAYQIVHGAATHGSQLNRVALGRCITLMDHLLCTILQIWIENGADEDWGLMCYPPRSGK